MSCPQNTAPDLKSNVTFEIFSFRPRMLLIERNEVQARSGKNLAPSCCVPMPEIVPTPTPENHRVFLRTFLLLAAEKSHSGTAARSDG